MMRYIFSLAILVIFLSGCGPNFRVIREYHLNQGNSTTKYTADGTQIPPVNVMILNLDAMVDTKTSAEQTAENNAELVAAWQAAQAAATKEGMTQFSDLINKYFDDKSKRNSDNSVPAAQDQDIRNTPPGRMPVAGSLEIEVHDLIQLHAGKPNASSKMYGWFSKKGEQYSGPLTVELEGCGTFTVPDPSKKWGPDGNPTNHNQAIYFPGDDPDQDKHPLGFASFVSASGCYEEGVARKMIVSYSKE